MQYRGCSGKYISMSSVYGNRNTYVSFIRHQLFILIICNYGSSKYSQSHTDTHMCTHKHTNTMYIRMYNGMDLHYNYTGSSTSHA